MEIKLNKIYNKDCFDLVKQIERSSVQTILMDPPSGAGLTKADWDKKMDANDYGRKYAQFIFYSHGVLKQSGSIFVSQWIGEKNPFHMAELLLSIDRLPSFVYDPCLTFKEFITWSKQRGNGNRKGFLQTNEHLLWYVKDNKKFTWNEEHQYLKEKRLFTIAGSKNKSVFKRITTVWSDIMEAGFGTCPANFKKERKKYGESLSVKPYEFYERQILLCSNPGDTVFIPFSGSGVAENVCRDLGRNFISCELKK